MSSRNASSARTRWATPSEMPSHSSAVKMRGTTSSGKGRSSPSRSKVTPWSMKARASRLARAETSSGPICASAETTSSYGARALRPLIISSKAASAVLGRTMP